MKQKSSLEGYVLQRLLGKGRFSEVWLGMKDCNRFAVKYISKELEGVSIADLKKQMQKEVDIMPSLDHPNVLKLREHGMDGLLITDTGEKKPVLYCVYDHMEQGELFDLVKKTGKFSDKLARYYFQKLIAALEHIHTRGFVHLDLKLDNILIDENLEPIIGDFNLSDKKEGKNGTGKLTGLVGTPGYMAPEILQGRSYSGEKVDIFAMGIILFSLIAQHPPWAKAVITDPFFNLFCKSKDNYWVYLEKTKLAGIFSEDFKSLINLMLSYKASERPTIEAIKKHPWFIGPSISKEDLMKDLGDRRKKMSESLSTSS